MIDLLKRVSIFEGADSSLLTEVVRALHLVNVKRGEVICRMGEPGSRLYLIKSGQVRISVRESEDQEITLGYLGPGDYFGEMSLLTGEPISANVTATVPTTLSALEGDQFRALCDENPILYRGISRTLSHRLRETNLRKFETSRGKVTRFATDQAPYEPLSLQRLLVDFAKEIAGNGSGRVLLFLPTSVANIHAAAFLADLGLSFQDEEGGEHEETNTKALLREIATQHPKHRHLWGRTSGGVDVLLWASPWEDSTWTCQRSFNEIIARLEAVYRHILVSQTGWAVDTLVSHIPPEDHLAFLLDFRWKSSQRKAIRMEYNRYIPEGNRIPPDPQGAYWVMSQESLDRVSKIRRIATEQLAECHHLHVLLLHDPSRPLLDFPHARRMLMDMAVHPIPLASGTNEVPPAKDEGLSYSLSLGCRPLAARSRVTRDISERQVGLALGGGGARGLAHIGVIKVLEEEGIPLDMIAGSSFGSVVAAAYGSGRNADRLMHDMKFHWGKLGNFLLDILDYNVPRTALLRGRKIRQMIETAMSDETIEECPIPVYVACTDLITGREVVLEKGKLGKAILASGSLPGIFHPVRWNQYLLVDGAVLNKVPAHILREKGARVIIAVNITPERETGLEASNRSPGWVRRCLDRIPPIRRWLSEPNILRIVSRSICVSGLHQSRIHNEAVDIEIKPRIEDFDFLRFDQFDQIVEVGMEAARLALPQIREAISMVERG